MTVSDVVIDLGEEREPPPVTRRPPSPRRRRVAGALLAAALIVGIGPTPVQAAIIEVHVPARPGDFFTVDGDRLYVTSPSGGEAGFQDRDIAAYRLPDGERLWWVGLRIAGSGPGVQRMGGMALVQSEGDRTGEIIAIDDATGAVRWRKLAGLFGWGPAPGPDGHAPPRVLIINTDRPGEPDNSTISAVDVRTGETAWSYRPPPGAYATPVWRADGGEVTRMMTVMTSGRIEVRELVSGRVLAAATLPLPVGATLGGTDWMGRVNVADDLILVSGVPEEGAVTAYGVDQLDRRWTARWDSVPTQSWYAAANCGDLLCVGQGHNGIRAIERDTGRTVWSADWDWIQPMGRFLLGAREARLGPNLSPKLAVLDPATGEVRYDLGEWTVPGPAALGALPMAMRHARPYDRSWFGILDPSIPDVLTLGVFPGVGEECAAGERAVVCRRRDGSLGIWRYQ